jgi:tetratricopeptide (TPR) repeat protein
MKKIIIILLTVVLTVSGLALSAQNDKIIQLEKKAIIAYANSSVFMWKQVVQELETIVSDKSPVSDKISALIFKYGLLYSCLSNKDEDTYEKYIDKTLEELETLLKQNPESSELYTISAALMSVQMGFSPMKGMTLGSLSGTHIDKAIKLDSLNPAAWRQHASSKYFTPKMFGGDIDIAIKSYEHAIKLFEKSNQINNWMYLDALVWLGIAYEKTEQPDKAKKVYEKALATEPDFGWVKNHLLPGLQKS